MKNSETLSSFRIENKFTEQLQNRFTSLQTFFTGGSSIVFFKDFRKFLIYPKLLISAHALFRSRALFSGR